MFPEIEEWMRSEGYGEMVANAESQPCDGCGEVASKLSTAQRKCWTCIRYAYGYDNGEYTALEEFARLMGEAWHPLTKWAEGAG